MKIALWLAGNLIFWLGVPVASALYINWCDEQAYQAGKLTTQELAALTPVGLLFLAALVVTTMIVVTTNLIVGIFWQIKRRRS